MTIIHVEHFISDGLAKEIEALEFHREDKDDPIKKDIFEFMQQFPETISGMELKHYFEPFTESLKILDIGCGPGFSSLYLSSLGHQVFSLEPSPLDCNVLLKNSKKMNLPITIFQCTAEVIDKIPEESFDLCIFNSSLHHCDDPLRSLLHCYSKLKNGGKILILNEPILKFYRSKRWFYRALERFPEKMGHYGGNEHIYYYNEYKKLLNDSGFAIPNESLSQRFYHPRVFLKNLITKKINGIYIDGDLKFLLKLIVLFIIKPLLSLGFMSSSLVFLIKKLSLLQVNFEAVALKSNKSALK